MKLIFPLFMIYALLLGCTNPLITQEDSINLPVSNTGEWIQTTYSYPANDMAFPVAGALTVTKSRKNNRSHSNTNYNR